SSSGRTFIPSARGYWDEAGSNYLNDYTGIKADITLRTDSNGKFSPELPPGFYDIFVTATAFTPRCDKIRVQSDYSRESAFLRAVTERLLMGRYRCGVGLLPRRACHTGSIT